MPVRKIPTREQYVQLYNMNNMYGINMYNMLIICTTICFPSICRVLLCLAFSIVLPRRGAKKPVLKRRNTLVLPTPASPETFQHFSISAFQHFSISAYYVANIIQQ